MRDYTYIDVAKGEILVVCLGFDNICKADYHFKDVVGVWPWQMKYVCVDSSPTSLADDEYIAISLED